MHKHFLGSLLVALPISALGTRAPAAQDARPHAGMLRYPDVSAQRIVFTYADDLWTVPRAGGVAEPLASPPGLEVFPRFSPDGQSIVFSGNYDGNRDLYVLPAGGGVPLRITHHPAAETPCEWTPSGEVMFFSNALSGLERQTQLFTVPVGGGLPAQIPVPYGAFGTLDASGRKLAYVPHTADARTWKRYRGGMATDVWVFDLEDKSSVRVTDWEGTDSLPMWHGDTLYYLSDSGPEHRLNIWAWSPASGEKAQITRFADYDVKWPAIGPGGDGQGEIVFQLGAELKLLDLATQASRTVEVIVPGARPTLRPKEVDASKFITSADLSPKAERAVASARGDVWTLPAKHGVPRNLSRSPGVFERDPSWSPDGRWIAYFADDSGEYELYVTQSDGKGEPRKLTDDKAPFRYGPHWSPDSKRIAFSDKAGNLFLHDVEAKETWLADTDPNAPYPGDMDMSWSHDGNWIAYARGEGPLTPTALWLYDVAARSKQRVTSTVFADSQPTFDREGELLFFQSNRSFEPSYGELDTSFVYQNTEVLMAVTLRADLASPFAPKSDEVDWDDGDDEEDEDEDEDDADEDGGEDAAEDEASAKEGDEASEDESEDEDDEKDKDNDKSEDDEPAEPLKIDLEGFERRAVPLPVESGVFGDMAVNSKGHLLYVRQPARGARGEAGVKIFDLEADEPEEKSVAAKVEQFTISANGEKILVQQEGKLAIQDAAADSKAEPIVTDGMKVLIDPRAEWRQILTDVWRLQRDFFYVENMHGVDWDGAWESYAAMLDDCVSRQDLSHVIREMISELNVGHAYYRGGDVGDEPEEGVGLLGVDFELADGAYRIQRIVEGAPWDSDARGPLSQPGVDAEAGDWLLAVNGVPVDVSKDPWAAFVGLAGKTISITLGDLPTLDDSARELVVKTLSTERDLRYRAWIEHNRARVDAQSQGKVGYVYVPDTGVSGQNDLIRQYYGQVDCAGLILDDRWNAGGQIPTRFIELLNRPITNYWARRDGADWPWPPDAHQGPKCMLTNGLAGSGGDAFPAYFKQSGLGKLIGTRTWGGLVGISGNPGLIDGAATTVPTFGYYEKDGTWGIEGHGVDPDVLLVDDPALMWDGGDPQLDAAIEHVLWEIMLHPYAAPQRPAPPDRSGMGLPDLDR